MCITQHYTINFYITDTSDKRQNPQAKTFKSRNGVDDNPSYDPENNAPRIRRRLLLSPAGETWVRRSPLPRPPTPPQFSLSSHHAHIPLWTIFFYINSSQAGTHLCVIVIAFFSPKCAITWKWSSSTSSIAEQQPVTFLKENLVRFAITCHFPTKMFLTPFTDGWFSSNNFLNLHLMTNHSFK